MREQEPRKPGGPPGHSRRDFLRGSGVAAATAVLTSQATLALDEAEAAAGRTQGPLGYGRYLAQDQRRGSRLQDRAPQHPAGRDASSTGRDGAEAGVRPRRAAARARRSSTAIRSIPAPRLAISCQGKTIETLESFDTGEKGVPYAFHQNDALMCGYCTPGFVTACKAFLDKNPNPTLDEVRKGLDGNICRCGTYVGVLNAALAAAKAMKGA